MNTHEDESISKVNFDYWLVLIHPLSPELFYKIEK